MNPTHTQTNELSKALASRTTEEDPICLSNLSQLDCLCCCCCCSSVLFLTRKLSCGGCLCSEWVSDLRCCRLLPWTGTPNLPTTRRIPKRQFLKLNTKPPPRSTSCIEQLVRPANSEELWTVGQVRKNAIMHISCHYLDSLYAAWNCALLPERHPSHVTENSNFLWFSPSTLSVRSFSLPKI